MSLFSLRLSTGGEILLSVQPGSSLYVLGPNGCGKSTLMYHMAKAFKDHCRRLAAHRQIWFSENAVAMSGKQSVSARINTSNFDNLELSRYSDGFHHERPMLAVSGLIVNENERRNRIVAAVDSKNFTKAQVISHDEPSILATLNTILRESNLLIRISVGADDEIMVKRDGSEYYNAAQMSDGERSAVLISAEVLAAEKGTIFLIDEPERHLHHSISSPLLRMLFQQRPDCAFVVSTHDITLAAASPNSAKLLLRSCRADGSQPSWEADLVTDDTNVDEQFTTEILGGRRTILFVEGSQGSLDKPLYALLFPNVTVISKNSCGEIIQAVRHAQETRKFNWLEVYGLIDSDGRDQQELSTMEEEGIFASDFYSIESLYYHPFFQKKLAEAQALITGDDADTMLLNAHKQVLNVLTRAKTKLCARFIYQRIRYAALSKLPKLKDIELCAQSFNVEIAVKDMLKTELENFERALAVGDIDYLIRRFSVKHSEVPAELAKLLGFQTRQKYEAAVRKCISTETETYQFARDLIGRLSLRFT